MARVERGRGGDGNVIGAQAPAERLRVLHVLAPAGAGGLERVVYGLSREQVRSGYEVLVTPVVSALEPISSWLADLKAAGVPVQPLEVPDRAYRREQRAVANLCRTFRPHVVHTHGFRPDVVDGAVARRYGIACVTTVHGMTSETVRARVYEWLQKRAFRRFDAVIAVSRVLGEQLLRSGVPADRLHVVANAFIADGTPLAREAARSRLGLPPDGFCIGWVGRVSAEKGPDVMIDAMLLLQDLPVTLVMIGDGPERLHLERECERRKLAAHVRWIGVVPNAPANFAAFDVFALSSRTEGTPMTLLEAMAARVPVVATRVGGVPDVVGPGEALLVENGDRRGLASAIRSVYEQRAAASTRAGHAQDRLAIAFRTDRWLADYDSVYRRVRRS